MSAFLKSVLPITVVCIVDEDTPDLRRCLRSVAWASQIVLLDSRQQLNQSVLQDDFPQVTVHPVSKLTNFAKTRNEGSALAINDWVLHIDSDEWWEDDQEVYAKILNTAQADSRYGAVSFQRVDQWHGRTLHWGEARPPRMIRLLHTTTAHFARPVHEVVETDLDVLDSHVVLHHAPHATLKDFLHSVAWYAELEAQHRFEQGLHFSLWQLVLHPMGKTVWNILRHQAWRDGWHGIVYTVVMSWHSWLVRAFLYEKTHS